MFNLRQRIFAGIGGVLAVIVAILLLNRFFFHRAPAPLGSGITPTPTTQQTQSPSLPPQGGTVSPGNAQVAQPPKPEPVAAKEAPESLLARQTARLFVERFQSYSTLDGNAHIRDVADMCTAKMRQWIATQALKEGGEYHSMSTRLVASIVPSIGGGRATVHMDVQQTSETGVITYRSGRVELAQEGAAWKVDGLYWDK